MGSIWTDADIIHTYTRAQALGDGVLVDVTEAAEHCGFRIPVAVTASAWAHCVASPDLEDGSDGDGRMIARLAHLLITLHAEIRFGRQGKPTDLLTFDYTPPGDSDSVRLWAQCGPGDTAEPVLTVGFPEDF